MSNIGVKPDDGTQGKLITGLEKSISQLSSKIHALENIVKDLSAQLNAKSDTSHTHS